MPPKKPKRPPHPLFQAILDLRNQRRVNPSPDLDDDDLLKKTLALETVIVALKTTPSEAASRLGITSRKVTRTLNTYKEHGFAFLFNESSGRKPTMTQEEEQMVCLYYIAYQKYSLSNQKMTFLLRDRGFDISSVNKLNRILGRKGVPNAERSRTFDEEAALRALEEDKEALSSRLFQTAIADYRPHDLDLDSPNLDPPIRRWLAIREMLLDPKVTKKELCNRYDMHQRRFQMIIDQFVTFGFEGLIDKPRGRATASIATPRMMVDLIRLWEERTPWERLPSLLDASTATLARAMTDLKIGRSQPRLEKLKRRWSRKSYQQITRGARKKPLKSSYLDEGYVQVLEGLKDQPRNICMPGIFLFAPLIQNLKLCELVGGLGLTKKGGYSLFHYLLLDVNRKLLGVENINQLDTITDPSLALASGLVQLPAASTTHKNLFRFDEPSVFKLMENLSRRAVDLGLVMGRKIAIDFHIIEYYGKNQLRLARWGKGPHTGKNRMVPGNRVLLAYDVETRCPVIAWRFNGKDRGKAIIGDFFEDVLDRGLGIYRCETVLMDAEFPSLEVIEYFERRQVRFIFAYIQYEWIRETYADLEDRFLPVVDKDGKEIRVFVMRLKIRSKWTDSVLIGYRNPDGKLFSLATNDDLLGIKDEQERAQAALDVVEEYRRRSDCEVEFFEQMVSYFLDRHPSQDEIVINLHYLTSLLGQMAYRQLQRFAPEGHCLRSRSLSTFRRDWMVGKNAVLAVEEDRLVIEYQEPARRKDHRKEMEVVQQMLAASDPVGHLNGLKIQVVQAGREDPEECTEPMSVKGGDDEGP